MSPTKSQPNTQSKPPVMAVQPAIKQVKYSHPNLKISPRKLRAVVALIKTMPPSQALIQLKFTNSNAARILYKAVQSLIADAKNNHHLSPETLKFATIVVNEGLKIKRMDKSHGARFARGVKIKRHSRLVITATGETKETNK